MFKRTLCIFIVISLKSASTKTVPLDRTNEGHQKLLVYPLTDAQGIRGASLAIETNHNKAPQPYPEANPFYKPQPENIPDNQTTISVPANGPPSPDYNNALNGVKQDLTTLKDSIRFLGETQRMLLESMKTKQQNEFETDLQPNPPLPIVQNDYNTLGNSKPEPDSYQPKECLDPNYSLGAQNYGNTVPTLSTNHLYNGPAQSSTQNTQYGNGDSVQKNDYKPPAVPNQYYYAPNPVPLLPNLPYGNDEETKTIIIKQRAEAPVRHQRLLPKQLPHSSPRSSLFAELRHLRQLRAERQSRAQMMFREIGDRNAQRSLQFLKQGLVQAFWTVLTVICVQIAPLVIFVAKLLFKSFLPGITGLRQTPLGGLGGGFDDGFRSFGVGNNDGFAMRRFVRNGFGAKQFGGANGLAGEEFEEEEAGTDEDFAENEQPFEQDVDIEDAAEEGNRRQGAIQRRSRFRSADYYR